MICKGTFTRKDIDNEISFVNEDGMEILYGFRHKFAPLKIIINGCDGKYNYLGETKRENNKSVFTILEDEMVIMEMEKGFSLVPKCNVSISKRSFVIKFTLRWGYAKISVNENGEEMASMTVRKRDYELFVKDGENPTLLSTIIIGVAEVNNLSDNMLN